MKIKEKKERKKGGRKESSLEIEQHNRVGRKKGNIGENIEFIENFFIEFKGTIITTYEEKYK